MAETKTLSYPASEINNLLANVKSSATIARTVTSEVKGRGDSLIDETAAFEMQSKIYINMDELTDKFYVADFNVGDIYSGGRFNCDKSKLINAASSNKIVLIPNSDVSDSGYAVASVDLHTNITIVFISHQFYFRVYTSSDVDYIEPDDISKYDLPKLLNEIPALAGELEENKSIVSANANKLEHISESTSGVAGIARGQFGVIPNITTGELEALFDDLKKSEFGIHAMRKLPPLVRQIEADYIEKTDNLENNKANIDGRYENMTSGFAENLTGRGDAIFCSFTEQPTGGTLSIKSGVARFKKIVGNTMRFRQEWPNPKFSNGVAPFSSASSLSVNNGVLRIRKNATNARERTSASLTTIANKFYYFSVEVRNVALPSGGTPLIQVQGMTRALPATTLEDAQWHRIEAFGQGTRTLEVVIDARAGMAEGSYIEVRNPQLFNISELGTLMCSINNADEFRKMFPDEYYPYSEKHKLIHMGNDYIITQGFNAAEVSGEGYSAELLGGKTYYIGGSRVNLKSITFDGEAVSLEPDMLFTPYKRGVLYCEGHNVCVNLHHSGYRDGEYQAFWQDARSIPKLAEIFPNGMKSVELTYDELTEEYAVKRVEMVDMASLEWRALSSGVYYAMISGIASAATVMCDIYTPATSPYTVSNGYDTLVDKTIYAYRNSAGVVSGVIIKDTNYPDPTQFIENIREGKIIYRLASEVKTRFREHEVSLDYIVDDFGTERVTSLDTYATFPCAPMVAGIVYDFNAVDEIRSNRNNIADLLARVEALEAAIATPIAEPIEEEL